MALGFRLGDVDNEGYMEGAPDGALDGTSEGTDEGANDGTLEGDMEGIGLGLFDGLNEGACEAVTDGIILGWFEGKLDGSPVADSPSELLLDAEGFIDDDGRSDGTELAIALEPCDGGCDGSCERIGVGDIEPAIEGACDAPIVGIFDGAGDKIVGTEDGLDVIATSICSSVAKVVRSCKVAVYTASSSTMPNGRKNTVSGVFIVRSVA